MSTVLEILNSTRDETITTHYDAALAELKEKLAANPLETTFIVNSGCPNKEVANEICRRLNNGGVKASLCRSGILSSKYYLSVSVDLPDHLVHSEETKKDEEENKTEENKTDEKKEN